MNSQDRNDTDITSVAINALESANFDLFGLGLQQQQLPDAFRILLSDKISQMLTRELGVADVADWILRPMTWDVISYGPRTILSNSEILLHLLWQDLSSRLILKLDSTFQRLTLASSGAILCFFSGTDLSIVVSYRRSTGGALSLRPIVVKRRSQAVFELTDLLVTASPEQRNFIKAAALSVDKLVFQRGVLVHVDRQREDVFGPAIDTILLAETLAQWLETLDSNLEIAALEVGCGSGLLCSLLAVAENVASMYAIDINPAAIACTLKNLQINGVRLDAMSPKVHVRGERFSEIESAQKVHLIVCNPPYIPDPPSANAGTMGGHQLAVGGLELSSDLLRALPSLLLPKGRLLLMTSSLSIDEILQLIPPGFEVIPTSNGKGLRVPLDVEDVWRLKDWRERLKSQGRIEEDGQGGLWHYIQPLWIVSVREDLHV